MQKLVLKSEALAVSVLGYAERALEVSNRQRLEEFGGVFKKKPIMV